LAPPAPSEPSAFESSDQVAPTEIERFTPAFASGTAAVAAAQPEAFAPERTAAHAPPTPVAATHPAQPEPPARAAAEPRQEHAPALPAASAAGSASSGIPEGLPEAERLKHERARRLARVLASDIAIYNKEKRDRGVKDGNLVAVLGYEIKKSWEVYKERVTPSMANSTPYFRDALNEMLSEGKKVF